MYSSISSASRRGSTVIPASAIAASAASAAGRIAVTWLSSGTSRRAREGSQTKLPSRSSR